MFLLLGNVDGECIITSIGSVSISIIVSNDISISSIGISSSTGSSSSSIVSNGNGIEHNGKNNGIYLS